MPCGGLGTPPAELGGGLRLGSVGVEEEGGGSDGL